MSDINPSLKRDDIVMMALRHLQYSISSREDFSHLSDLGKVSNISVEQIDSLCVALNLSEIAILNADQLQTSPKDFHFRVKDVKKAWKSLPISMVVIEFFGDGDPFFGGKADDRSLGYDGDILCGTSDRCKVRKFSTIEEAAEAASKIRNRRPGSSLSVVPQWR